MLGRLTSRRIFFFLAAFFFILPDHREGWVGNEALGVASDLSDISNGSRLESTFSPPVFPTIFPLTRTHSQSSTHALLLTCSTSNSPRWTRAFPGRAGVTEMRIGRDSYYRSLLGIGSLHTLRFIRAFASSTSFSS